MPIEQFSEVPAYLEANKDNEDVKKYIGGLITSDRVGSFLESEDGKKLLQPKLDSYHGKGLETWKANNLQKEVEALYKKNHPDADPKDIELNKLKAEFEAMKNESSKKELMNKALKVAQEKKLPIDLVDFFIGSDEASTVSNLTALEKVFSTNVEALVAERLKSTYIPPGGGGGGTKIGLEALQAQYDAAVKAGKTALSISLKNKIFEEQNKK